ncbi:uncharacterized protein LOC113318544 [Papaver somniferum]|uniref:uncharacterized protein LOC113318544 n=1 Tax=Papaver somniferum TaxID=3469 RepID=UPI000E6FA8C6|nr:uncharacterized protein LOC113318544 [Papaver somniferum]
MSGGKGLGEGGAKLKLQPHVSKYKLMKYLDGSYPCPAQYTNPRNQANGVENSLYTDWMDEDSSIMMWIHSTISDSVIPYFSRATTSHEMWTSIEERFARAPSTHSIQLRTKLLSLTQGTKIIPALINEIKMLSDQLAVVGEVISDKELVVITLKALNSDYIPFDTSMRSAILKLGNDAKAFMEHSGRGSYRGPSYNSRGSLRGRGYGGGRRFPNPVIFHRFPTGRGYPSPVKQQCQLCLGDDHLAPNCT